MMKNKIVVPLLLLIPFLVTGCEESGEETPKYDTQIKNGSFEDGLVGWTVGGLGGFSEEDVSNASSFEDGQQSEKVGEYMYAGASMSLPAFTGTLTSDPFHLGGIANISLKLGAASNTEDCYIEFYEVGKDDVPLTFYLDGDRETEYTKLVNTDFNGTTIRSIMIRHVVDLREHLEKDIYIKITDNATESDYEDYSFFNLDDFKLLMDAQERNDALVEREDQLLMYQQADIDASTPVESLRNGGFETGDTSYWLPIAGEAFLNDSMIVPSSSLYWETRQYHAQGEYFLSNLSSGEDKTGKMRSERFKVIDKGNGKSYATFMIGAASQPGTYVAVNDGETGEELLKVYNTAFKDPDLAQNLIRYYVDLSEYIGKTLYFTIVDNVSTGGFAFIEVDDFVINLSEQEVIDGVASLRNWANEVADDVAKNAYINAYNGGISFPLGGQAPVIDETNGVAQELTISPQTMNLNVLFKQLSYSDDYTATNDLKTEITSLLYNGNEVEGDYSNFELNVGEYVVNIKISDAFDNFTDSIIKLNVLDNLTYDNQIENGGFETGNLDGWLVLDGNVNTDNAICSDDTWWAEDIPFNKSGTYFFNGWNACSVEAEGYTLKSTTFTLNGSGQITFKLGGRSSKLTVKNETNEVVAEYRNYAFQDVNFPYISQGCRLATMNTYVADLSQYLGENLYIEICDEVISESWAVAFFDDINVYHEQTINIDEHYDVVIQNGEEVRLPWLEARSN